MLLTNEAVCEQAAISTESCVTECRFVETFTAVTNSTDITIATRLPPDGHYHHYHLHHYHHHHQTPDQDLSMPKQLKAALSREAVARSTSFTTSARANSRPERTSRLLSWSATRVNTNDTSRSKSSCVWR